MVDLSKPLYIYDIETDGLIDDATKIHCLSMTYRDGDGVVKTESTVDYDKMTEFFSRDIIRIGHNITLYDERVSANILGVDIKNHDHIVDTLALSWYLYPEHQKHSLEAWGERLGVAKVQIGDWKNLTSEQYIERCEVDTQINFKLWELLISDLRAIYTDEKAAARLITYLQFKMDCIREQEEVKLRMDIPKTQANIEKLTKLKEEKTKVLAEIMPKKPITKKKVYKNVIVIGDEFHTKGDLMFEHYKSLGHEVLPEYTAEKILGYEEPNPNSVDQKKDWLFSLGWVPRNFNMVKNKDGSTRKVPQIASVDKTGICESIKDLFDKEPRLEVLEGLTVLSHRIGVLEGLLNTQKNGFIEASALGFTNTLRLRHTNVVNLPGVEKKFGKEIREVFVANEGMILCGSDMSSLEDTTKQHYIYNYDPDYVNEMRTPGFDPHLDIAVLAGLMTQEESDEHKLYGTSKGKEGKNHKATRHLAKTTNFSATYGAGPPKIAATGNIPLAKATLLHKIYWQRNAAVKKTAEACVVKSHKAKKWLYNPVSGFWYSLRAEKDRFSTLNQGTGVYCFDMQILAARRRGIKISLQMHDEILFNLPEDDKERITKLLYECIDEVNNKIKLNVKLGISVDFGHSYADCH